jgi:hypothetical protein
VLLLPAVLVAKTRDGSDNDGTNVVGVRVHFLSEEVSRFVGSPARILHIMPKVGFCHP